MVEDKNIKKWYLTNLDPLTFALKLLVGFYMPFQHLGIYTYVHAKFTNKILSFEAFLGKQKSFE